MLVLIADDRRRFLEYAGEHPAHDVEITWDSEIDEGRTWTITPIAERNAYQLTFRVPQSISYWISSSKNSRRAALDAKRKYFSDITIYRHESGKDSLIRLNFDADRLPKPK